MMLRKLSRINIRGVSTCFKYSVDDFDLNYLCDESKTDEISSNIRRRKGPGDIKALVDLNKSLRQASDTDMTKLKQMIVEEAFKIPNRCHPESFALTGEPKTVREMGTKLDYEFTPSTFEDIAKSMNLTRTENLTNLTGDRSYYLVDGLAHLERALIQYFVDYLEKLNFQFISVPDILPRWVIEACGMNTHGERTQVYRLDEDIHGKDLCLSGTAEMGIASCLCNKVFSDLELPLRLAAVSRCFRAETSKISEEKGIYRVHAFTKVEMFGVCSDSDSDRMLSEFVSIEEKLFSSLGLCLRTLEMPPEELGAQAYRKYDVEAWLPGKKRWAELSSASDCTDYQSRRLNVKRRTESGKTSYVHTLNGTAAAIPRLVMAIVETHQNRNKSITIPKPLQSYMNNEIISKSRLPQIKPYKGRSFYP